MSRKETESEYMRRLANLYWREAVRMAAQLGWSPFGTHVDQPGVQLEFDGADEVGEPIWERPRREGA